MKEKVKKYRLTDAPRNKEPRRIPMPSVKKEKK